MKKILITLAVMALFAGVTQAARQNAVDKEMEDYARDLFRAHPEAAGDDKPRDAAKKMYEDAKQNRLLELTKDEEKILRKREEMVVAGRYSAAIDQLKALNSKDPKISFLIKYAENPKIKSDEKLLAYRLMQHNYKKAAVDAARARRIRITTILTKYRAYKDSNDGKAPPSLGDLDLPEDCQKFTNSKGEEVDYIYIGHLGPRLNTNNTHVVLIEPEPLGDNRVCGLDDGNVANFKNSQVQPHIDKIVKSMNDGTAPNSGGGGDGKAGGGQAAPAGALTGFMKRYKIFKELNNDKEPSSIDELNLADKDKNYTDPGTGEKLDWIFLGSSSKISAGEGIKVIVASPKPSGGSRLAGLSNGKVVTIKESQIGPMLNK